MVSGTIPYEGFLKCLRADRLNWTWFFTVEVMWLSLLILALKLKQNKGIFTKKKTKFCLLILENNFLMLNCSQLLSLLKHLIFCLHDTKFPCSSTWAKTYYVNQAGFELIERSSCSASQVLGLKLYAIYPGLKNRFIKELLYIFMSMSMYMYINMCTCVHCLKRPKEDIPDPLNWSYKWL